MVLSSVIRAGTLAKRLYGYGKPVVTGKSFVSKFPPQHRQTVRTILKGAEISFTGGLIADILKDNMGLTDTGNDGIQTSQQRSPTGKQNKAYHRYGRRSRGFRRNNKYSNMRGRSKRGHCCVQARRC